MLHQKNFPKSQFQTVFVGAPVSEGSDGAGSTGTAIFSSPTADFVTDAVAAGDHVYIDGEGEFTVLTRDSLTQLTFTSNMAANVVAASFKVTRGRLIDDFDTEVKSLIYDHDRSMYAMVYESDPPSFTVS